MIGIMATEGEITTGVMDPTAVFLLWSGQQD
jgi:hypothetical protein